MVDRLAVEVAAMVDRLAVEVAAMVDQRYEFGFDKGAELGGEPAMAVVEHRPVEKAPIGHQLPSNTGRSLATKAR